MLMVTEVTLKKRRLMVTEVTLKTRRLYWMDYFNCLFGKSWTNVMLLLYCYYCCLHPSIYYNPAGEICSKWTKKQKKVIIGSYSNLFLVKCLMRSSRSLLIEESHRDKSNVQFFPHFFAASSHRIETSHMQITWLVLI